MEIDETFEEIPASLLHERDWKVVGARRWVFEEGILVLEARALVMGLQRQACLEPCRNTRLLFFADNLAVVLSFGRGRAKNYKLLCQIRKFYAYAFVRNLRVAVRWVPSELNPSR